jgi:methionine synthase II (cobalamin-independent)
MTPSRRLGCVDVTPGRIDSAATIAGRVRLAARHLAPERITLNPDCGFAPGSGAVVSLDEAYQNSATRPRPRASCGRKFTRAA